MEETSLLKDIGVCKEKLSFSFLDSPEICELMIGKKNYSEEEVHNLIYKQIFPYLYIDDTQTEVMTYICLEVDIPRIPTHTIKNVQVIIWICSHKEDMKYSKYGYLGNTVQEILDGINYRTEEIVKENAAIEDSIKSIENQLDALKTKYDAATASAKQLAAANDAATQSANNLAAARAAAANAGKTTTVSKPAKGSSVSSGSTRVSGHQTMAVFHEGTNYVKKANTWLDDMLGLAPNETAAILKEGEAVIPDYNNPANPSSNFSYGKMAESMSKSITYSNSNSDDSASVVIGDIIIQGNADSTIVDKLDKVRKQIVDDVFKTMNKHTNMGGYRSVKHAY